MEWKIFGLGGAIIGVIKINNICNNSMYGFPISLLGVIIIAFVIAIKINNTFFSKSKKTSKQEGAPYNSSKQQYEDEDGTFCYMPPYSPKWWEDEDEIPPSDLSNLKN